MYTKKKKYDKNSQSILAIPDKISVMDGKLGGTSRDKSISYLPDSEGDYATSHKLISHDKSSVNKLFLHEGCGFNNPSDRKKYHPLLEKSTKSSGI